MFIDACAIVAILSDEPEALRCSNALLRAEKRMTSAIAVWEAAVALARPDKFAVPVDITQALVMRFLEERGIELCESPPAHKTVALTLGAAGKYRTGPRKLNLADCFHYAAAKYYGVPVLSTDDEFRFTDLDVVNNH